MITMMMDFVLAILLSATCIYCVVLNRRLATLKKGQSDLQSSITVFDNAVKRAQITLDRLEENGIDQSRSLETSMHKASALAAELSVMIGAGDNIAARIEGAMRDVRAFPSKREKRQTQLERCA